MTPGESRRVILAWLGIDWDEGPDIGGPHAPYSQSARFARYSEALQRLHEAGRLYPCFCSRKDVAAAASAPQKPGEERRYPGTCRRLSADESQARIESGQRHSYRVRVEAAERFPFEDLVHGGCRPRRAPGDFVIGRSDGVPAYHLAVVVDDAAMGINEVVRGDDLIDSTYRQLLLFEVLGLQVPAFGHVPLLMGSDGARLSKRHQGVTLRELRESGLAAEGIVGGLARLLQLRPTAAPLSACELVDDFDITRLKPSPDGLVVDLTTF